MAGSSTSRESGPVDGYFVDRPWRVPALIVWLVAMAMTASCSSGAAPIDQPTTATVSETAETPAESGQERRFDLQGHRGARGLRPENTLPSFEIALDLEVTTLELDLHLSADGEVVVWHDPVIDSSKCRIDEEAPADLPDPASAGTDDLAVRSLTAAQLSQYRCDLNPDLGRFPDQSPEPGTVAAADYGIVTLDRLFAFVADYAAHPAKTESQRSRAGQVRFNIETKRNPAAPDTIDDGFDGEHAGPFELAVLDAIGDAGLEARVTVQSFDHRSLRAIGAEAPGLSLAALTRDRVSDPGVFSSWGAGVWSPNVDTLSEDSIEAAHAAGMLVIPWTVNDPAEMQAALDLGVDGLITDRPDRAP